MTKSSRPKLGVNIDHVATLREARGTAYPSILKAAENAINGGADQITVHLREDRRHIQDHDIFDLKKNISVPLNLEMAAADEIVKIAVKLKPKTATLVPEKREELTTEGGLDCVSNKDRLKTVVGRLREAGIEVNLFIDPDIRQVEMAKELNATSIELHTGQYCELFDSSSDYKPLLDNLIASARLGREAGLKICAGHGLNYKNTEAVVKNIPEIKEYNIGHSIVARAVFVGLKDAVKEMADILSMD